MPEPPTPQRLRRPRWMDARVIGGVLLLVASVVLGAKVIGSSSHTSPVWSASRDLAAGTVIDRGDLVAVEVNLGDSAAAYLDASAPLTGRVLGAAVHAGELIPADAIGDPTAGRVVSIPVEPDRMAPGVAHGSVIDLYLTDEGSAAGGDDDATRLQQGGITVQSVVAPSSGGLSGATFSKYQVALLLSPDDADRLVRALPGTSPLIVLRSDGADLGGDPDRRPAADGDSDASVGDGEDEPVPADHSAAPQAGG